LLCVYILFVDGKAKQNETKWWFYTKQSFNWE
jgi:hypothetical protein